jgi:hypothetical protein
MWTNCNYVLPRQSTGEKYCRLIHDRRGTPRAIKRSFFEFREGRRQPGSAEWQFNPETTRALPRLFQPADCKPPQSVMT